MSVAEQSGGLFGSGVSAQRVKNALVVLLLLAFVSAVWIETDAYRKAGLVLIAWGLVARSRSDCKPSFGWMGYACIAWALYVAIRYLVTYQWGGLTAYGSSEGIYLLPFLYMGLAFMLFAYRHVLERVSVLFVLVSLVMAAATVDLTNAFDGDFHEFFVTNNRIHGSVGGGFVILAAINVAGFASRTVEGRHMRWAIEAACYATIVLCVIGLFGAKSKGVWAAIAIALVVHILLSIRAALGQRTMVTGAALLAGLGLFILLFHQAIWNTVGPSLDGLTALFLEALASDHPVATIREAIACGGLPRGTYLRLMMWHDAVEVWSHNILFGNGIAWEDLYGRAFYAGNGFDVVHNGYLEIAMRYGLLGLGFFATVFGWTVAMANRARRLGLIAPEAFNFHVTALVFFAVTIATNANNRLAIGESYMMAAAAFGFYCLYLDQHRLWLARRGSSDR